MERLTTAYERIWVDGRMETQYVAKEESVMEIENKLGKYEDAEEEGRLFITPCKPGDLIYEVDVIERPEWDCYVNGFVVQDVSANKSSMKMIGLIGMHLMCTQVKRKHERKQSS